MNKEMLDLSKPYFIRRTMDSPDNEITKLDSLSLSEFEKKNEIIKENIQSLCSFEEMLDFILPNIENTIEKLILPNLEITTSNTRLDFININSIADTINRDPEHIIFILKKYSGKNIQWLSANKSEGVYMDGKKLKAKYLQDLILKYVNEYVVCSSCMNTNTILIKDKDTKKFKFTCSCGYFKYI